MRPAPSALVSNYPLSGTSAANRAPAVGLQIRSRRDRLIRPRFYPANSASMLVLCFASIPNSARRVHERRLLFANCFWVRPARIRAARNCLPVMMFDMDQPPFICRWKANWFFAGRGSLAASDCRCSDCCSCFIGRPTGAVIPIAARAATALAFRNSYQAGQQRECSQAWPAGSTPQGSNGSWASSRSPHPRQRTADTGAIGYVRDWSYPANHVEPATGVPSRGIGRWPLSRHS
jgi:hypothetical protein